MINIRDTQCTNLPRATGAETPSLRDPTLDQSWDSECDLVERSPAPVAYTGSEAGVQVMDVDITDAVGRQSLKSALTLEDSWRQDQHDQPAPKGDNNGRRNQHQ